MPTLRNNKSRFNKPKSELEAMDKYFDRLFDEIERLKEAESPFDFRDWRDSYNPLEQAAYHLCRCRNLVEAFSEQSLSKNRYRKNN